MRLRSVVLVFSLLGLPFQAFSQGTAEYREAYRCALEALRFDFGPASFCVGNSRDPSDTELEAYADAQKDFAADAVSARRDVSDSPNVKLTVEYPVNRMFGVRYLRVGLQAMGDSVLVEDIVVNRGNCKIENKDVISGAPILPKALKFGQKLDVAFSFPCEAIEISVMTNNGDWVWRFD